MIQRIIQGLREEGWTVNGSLDERLEIMLKPAHSRLQVEVIIRKLSEGDYRTITGIYISKDKDRGIIKRYGIIYIYSSTSERQAIENFMRFDYSLAGACIDGITSVPQLLKFHRKYQKTP